MNHGGQTSIGAFSFFSLPLSPGVFTYWASALIVVAHILNMLEAVVAEPVSTFGGGSGCSDGLDVLDRLGETGYDVLVDGSLMDLETGGVGLEAARKALSRGNAAVLANKAPLVTAFDELSKYGASRLFFSATVCGGCPVVNIGRRDLGFAAEFTEVAGVFNSTSNFILKELGDGNSFDSALCTAQELGIAEADPSKDIDG